MVGIATLTTVTSMMVMNNELTKTTPTTTSGFKRCLDRASTDWLTSAPPDPSCIIAGLRNVDSSCVRPKVQPFHSLSDPTLVMELITPQARVSLPVAKPNPGRG